MTNEHIDALRELSTRYATHPRVMGYATAAKAALEEIERLQARVDATTCCEICSAWDDETADPPSWVACWRCYNALGKRHGEAKAEIARLKTLSLSCCFCNAALADLAALKSHCPVCPLGPVVEQRVRADRAEKWALELLAEGKQKNQTISNLMTSRGEADAEVTRLRTVLLTLADLAGVCPPSEMIDRQEIEPERLIAWLSDSRDEIKRIADLECQR